jgi:hypothetical protein
MGRIVFFGNPKSSTGNSLYFHPELSLGKGHYMQRFNGKTVYIFGGSSGIGVSVLCPPDTDTPGFHEENLTKPEETKKISANARLMQPEQVAQALVRGLRKNRFMIIPGFAGKLTYYAKRLLPGLVAALMDRDVKKVQKAKEKSRTSNIDESVKSRKLEIRA